MLQTQGRNDVLEFLAHHAPYNLIAPEHRAFLAERLTAREFNTGDIISSPEQGEARFFYIIKQGKVRGEPLEGDDTHHAWELTAGESFPLGALLSHRPVHTRHRAVDKCLCYQLTRDDFDTLLQLSPLFNDFANRRLASLLDHSLHDRQIASFNRLSQDATLETPLKHLLHRTPISCSPDTPIHQALALIEQQQRRSIAVVDAQQRPVGILTLRDVMVRVTLARVDIDRPIAEVMTPAPQTLPPQAPAFEAAQLMARSGIGHVCVVDDDRFIGIVSERDLFAMQRVGLGNLSQAISHAPDIQSLVRLNDDLQRFVHQMLAQGIDVEQLTALISELNDGTTRRVIALCEQAHGRPVFAYCWLAFGSEGRLEQTLKTDQDNGMLIYIREGESAEQARQALLPLARSINQALAEVGFVLCPGNIMAGNPECCLTLAEWQHRFDRWIDQGTPEHLLNASIYFDFRPLHGDSSGAQQLRDWLLQRTRSNSRFRRQMAANALRLQPPLGLFGDLKTGGKGRERNMLDLKLNGITPFVDAARIIALAHGIAHTNTLARLRAAAQQEVVQPKDAQAYGKAYGYIQLLRMRAHEQALQHGNEPSNQINPDELNELDRRILKESFRQARKLQASLALEYQL